MDDRIAKVLEDRAKRLEALKVIALAYYPAQRCEAEVVDAHWRIRYAASRGKPVDLKCTFRGAYEIAGKKLCQRHAAQAALALLLAEATTVGE